MCQLFESLFLFLCYLSYAAAECTDGARLLLEEVSIQNKECKRQTHTDYEYFVLNRDHGLLSRVGPCDKAKQLQSYLAGYSLVKRAIAGNDGFLVQHFVVKEVERRMDKPCKKQKKDKENDEILILIKVKRNQLEQNEVKAKKGEVNGAVDIIFDNFEGKITKSAKFGSYFLTNKFTFDCLNTLVQETSYDAIQYLKNRKKNAKRAKASDHVVDESDEEQSDAGHELDVSETAPLLTKRYFSSAAEQEEGRFGDEFHSDEELDEEDFAWD